MPKLVFPIATRHCNMFTNCGCVGDNDTSGPKGENLCWYPEDAAPGEFMASNFAKGVYASETVPTGAVVLFLNFYADKTALTSM